MELVKGSAAKCLDRQSNPDIIADEKSKTVLGIRHQQFKRFPLSTTQDGGINQTGGSEGLDKPTNTTNVSLYLYKSTTLQMVTWVQSTGIEVSLEGSIQDTNSNWNKYKLEEIYVPPRYYLGIR